MLIYVICYGVGMLSASSAHSCISGVCLMAAACWLYFRDYRRTGNPLDLQALFSLFWVGGQGLSCLKLSRLQGEWSMVTWLCFFLAFAGFRAVYWLLEKKAAGEFLGKKISGGKFSDGKSGEDWGQMDFGQETGEKEQRARFSRYGRGVNLALILLTAVSLSAFLLEAAVLGYVPFFLRGVPHAYSYFHISGVHYFTVSCVLVPSMAVLLFFCDLEDRNHSLLLAVRWGAKRLPAIVSVVISFLIPILCVSRFQLVFSAILAVLTFMTVSGKKKIRYLILAAVVLIPFYVILTIARSHDVAYLNGIFEMKNADMPIFITQPYMYIANNYDNFNCLVEQLPGHSFGIKGLFPLWALTGLKFLRPELVSFPLYTTKEELTTVTLFYDAYYDFGIAGVLAFSCILGGFAFWLSKRQRQGKNPAWQLFYGQAALYFMLSFFTTWYSNPTTWFYFAATGAFAVFIEICKEKGPKGQKESEKGENLWYQKK